MRLWCKKPDLPIPSEDTANSSLWGRLKAGLGKSSERLAGGIAKILTHRRLDAAALEALEELLIGADLGPKTAADLIQALRAEKFERDVTDEEVRNFLAEKIAIKLAPLAHSLAFDNPEHRKPFVVMVVGVNGTGKTTTLGKLAKHFTAEGHRIMLAAGDTFRAAAVAQLQIWGDRAGVSVIVRDQGTDSAALAYDALEAAEKSGTDILMLDTAGRLHNKTDLMAELQKVVRTMKKRIPTAPHLTLLVLDATTGQNALAQAETFKQMVDVNGLVITKLDGSAKGGVVVALAERFNLPIYAIGVGEAIEDLQPFDPEAFARALLGASGDKA